MTRKFEPTEKQIAKWTALKPDAMPTDDEFKAMWKKAHHGKEAGWGMGKRDWMIAHQDDHMTCTVEYNLGLWQGRIDAANKVDPMVTNEYHTNPFHFGYYAGYNGFDSFWKGYDRNARAEFTAKYVEA